MDNTSKNRKPEIFAGYIPVIHRGLLDAINRHPEAAIGVFNNEILSDFDYIRKDIRALDPEEASEALSGLGRTAIILGKAALKEVLKGKVIMPNDDISREIVSQNPNADIYLEPIFLRWDRDNTSEISGLVPDRVITLDSDDPIIRTLNQEKSLCTNWWRHVSAVVVDSSQSIQLSSHNANQPTEYTAIFESDPRITTKRGENIDRNIETHAELSLIAEAGRRGISLEGQSIYVSTFPCPNCAKLIALSGIKHCYFFEGYAMLDGQRILKDYEVEIIKVETELQPDDDRVLKPYPTKS